MAHVHSIYNRLDRNDVPYNVRFLLTDEGRHKYKQLIEATIEREDAVRPDTTVAAYMTHLGDVVADPFVSMDTRYDTYVLRACWLRCGVTIAKVSFRPSTDLDYYAFGRDHRAMTAPELNEYWTQEVEPLMALCRLSR